MKTLFTALLCLLTTSLLFCDDNIIGFWKTINEHSHKPESIVAVYKYGDLYYGRIIATYDRDGNFDETYAHHHSRAPGARGNPYYIGLDIIWDLQKDFNNNHYVDGKIMDPEQGKIYGAELWNDNGNLIVRGKLFIFGRNQTWPPATDADFPENFEKPDLTTFVPAIPQAK